MDKQIEYVARAFYDAEDGAQVWDREPEILKEEFRKLAREAVALLEEQRAQEQHELGAFDFSYAA